MTTHHRQSMRAFLAMADEAGALTRISESVDPVHEIAAWLSFLDGRGLVVFENVAGHAMAVTGNHLTTRAQAARALGVDSDRLQDRLVDALRSPLAPRVVAGHAPCREVVVPEPDLATLPIPTFFEHDTGPYITAGAIVARDTVTGSGNLSIARLKPLGANRAFIGIAPNHHLATLARAARARGERLEIAVTLGNHPAVLLAACFYLGLGDDELVVAGALLGEPLDVVPCQGVDLAVPAHCEIVLEGVLDPDETVEEGPVSEFHGMYERYGAGHVVTFSHMTRRSDAVFQCVLPGYAGEHILLGAEAIAAGLRRSLQRTMPSVRAVAVTAGGAGRLHAVVSLDGAREGAARRTIFAVLAAVSLVKQVTVVDGGVDPWDPVAVEHAVATRMRPERDLIVVPGAQADRAEPMEKDGVVGKLGIDATTCAADRPDWTRARPPEAVLAKIRERIARRPGGSGTATPGSPLS